MDQIPTEILCAIFSLSISQSAANSRIITKADVSQGRTWPYILQLDKGPWSLSKVCRKWRTISTSFPELWSRFILSEDDLGTHAGRNSIAALRKWLSLTGTSKLSFLIQTDGVCNLQHNDAELFPLLVEQAERWERIEIINSSYAFWSSINQHDIGSRLQSLKSVTFLSEGSNQSYIDDGYQSPFVAAYYDIFQQSPNFHSIINRDYFSLADLLMPWSQLTHYEGSHRVGFDDHFTILRRTPNLETCILGIEYCSISLTKFSPMVLERLKSLKIVLSADDDEFDEFSFAIRCLVAPSLTELSIQNTNPSTSASYDPFIAMLRSVSPGNLSKLELVGNAAEPRSVIDLLEASSDVKHLSLGLAANQASVLLETAITSLSPTAEAVDGDRALLPLLSSLEIRIPQTSSVREVDFSKLALAVRSRWKSHSGGIQSLWISLGDREVEELFRYHDYDVGVLPPILEVLKEEGLTVVVRETCHY
ncbi:hypothetical protein PM082_012305 [Marasmius tenuissimus]|nr:hypothetical protein PM082_012305 [Marasmius tenuissimus]